LKWADHLKVVETMMNREAQSRLVPTDFESVPEAISVCLVEDHEAVRTHLTDLLRSHGYDVVAAVGTTAAGEQSIVTHRPQMAVIDARLPDGQGVELCARLRAAAPEVPLILYSAQVSSDERRAALDIGVAAVVLKNVQTNELLEAIERHARP
jgi:two-component system, NarL family, response regulator DevR